MILIYQDLQILISISLISVFLTGYYTPINPAREWLVDKWIGFWVRKQLYKVAELAILITCAKCMAFILALTITWNLPGAILSSIIALVIKYTIKYVTKDQ